MPLPRVAVDLGAVREGLGVVTRVALARRNEADAAVLVVVVVPADERGEGERLVGVTGPVLEGATPPAAGRQLKSIGAVVIREASADSPCHTHRKVGF